MVCSRTRGHAKTRVTRTNERRCFFIEVHGMQKKFVFRYGQKRGSPRRINVFLHLFLARNRRCQHQRGILGFFFFFSFSRKKEPAHHHTLRKKYAWPLSARRSAVAVATSHVFEVWQEFSPIILKPLHAGSVMHMAEHSSAFLEPL